VLPGLWLFPPNRDTGGGSAWLLETAAGDLLIDCPGLGEAALEFLAARAHRRREQGLDPPGWIVLLGREGHGRCRKLQQALGWPVLVQEQEAYLLPGVAGLHTFAGDFRLAEGLRLLWTPGPTPGACVLHASGASVAGTDGLFCGRLLVPVGPDRLAPRRSRRTFHWPRQLRSLERLAGWLPAGSPRWLASGAPLGALRGGRLVSDGARLLAELAADLSAPA
jgi:glyoxylase-like metal-dependent hydrolase (beta-lactamase superfamily II)